MSSTVGKSQLDTLTVELEQWFNDQAAENPAVRDVERDPTGERRWFLRLIGETKQGFTLVIHLDQRTTRYETHFMPLPEENAAQLFEHLLIRNGQMYGASFSIAGLGPASDGPAIYLGGQIDNTSLAANLDTEMDRIVGSIYVWVDQYFLPAIKIGFASRFATESSD